MSDEKAWQAVEEIRTTLAHRGTMVVGALDNITEAIDALAKPLSRREQLVVQLVAAWMSGWCQLPAARRLEVPTLESRREVVGQALLWADEIMVQCAGGVRPRSPE